MSAVICPHCRQTNFEWARRCFRCGAPIHAIVRSLPPVPTPATSDPATLRRLIERLYCECFERDDKAPITLTRFHTELQDEQAEGWKQLLDLVERAAADGREEFAPFREMTMEARSQVVTLPPTIAKLKGVKSLVLYGSYLVRIPPEIGEMDSLEEFTPYRSMRLHWFPYEITRCTRLVGSTVSTRALYGNYKHRPPFPQLEPAVTSTAGMDLEHVPPWRNGATSILACSVCRAPFARTGLHQVWISLNVGTDVLPLLVNACSAACVGQLPPTPPGYVSGPHTGGRFVDQPPPKDTAFS